MSVKEGRVRRCAFDRYHGVVAKRLQPYMLDVAAHGIGTGESHRTRAPFLCCFCPRCKLFNRLISVDIDIMTEGKAC